MTRKEAHESMKNGNKVAHRFFSPNEFYHMVEGEIIAEDGVNHTEVFWGEEHGNFRETGWYVIS